MMVEWMVESYWVLWGDGVTNGIAGYDMHA